MCTAGRSVRQVGCGWVGGGAIIRCSSDVDCGTACSTVASVGQDVRVVTNRAAATHLASSGCTAATAQYIAAHHTAHYIAAHHTAQHITHTHTVSSCVKGLVIMNHCSGCGCCCCCCSARGFTAAAAAAAARCCRASNRSACSAYSDLPDGSPML